MNKTINPSDSQAEPQKNDATETPTIIVVPFKSIGVSSATQLVAHDEQSFDSWYKDVVSNCDALMEVKLVVGGREQAAAYFDTRASQHSTLCPRNVKEALSLHKYLNAGK